MMICNKVNVIVVLLTWMKLVISNGEYLSAAIPVWTKEVGQISKGNGAFMSPNGKLLIVVAKDAIVVGFEPKTGTELWKYTPEASTIAQSLGGAFFSEYNQQAYVLFSVVENAIFPEIATRYVLSSCDLILTVHLTHLRSHHSMLL